MENRTLTEFSVQTASSAPTPGGGGVAAACGALSAALGEMVTNLTIGKKKYLEYTDELNELKNELEQLRISLLEAIEGDARAFLPLAAAYALPKDTPDYQKQMEACLRNAAASPYEIMLKAKRIIEIDERLARISSRLAISDAASSVILAQSVLATAYVNVLINTRLMKDEEYADDLNKNAERLYQEYSRKAQIVYDEITGELK